MSTESKPDTLSWSVHRAKETPGRTWLAGVFIFVFLTFVAVFFGLMLAVLGAVVLAIALNAYFLPVTVTFHERGLTIDKRLFKAEYPWAQFRRWVRSSGGIVLSPFSRKNYLDNFRGVHLMLPEDDSAIVAYLARRFAPPEPDTRLTLDDEPKQ